MREYFCTHKLDNWDNKDKASGMLPFKRFLARDLHVKRRGRKEKAYSTHMNLATDFLLNRTRKS